MIDALPLLLGPEGYQISRSVRLRKSATAYLNRTFGTPTSLTTWTWSGWVKRGELGTSQYLFHTRNAGNTVSWETFFQTDNTLIVRNYDGASYNANYVTTQLFRDPSAWYHMVVTWDTTNATSTDRVRIYINGSRVTAFNTSTAPASSANSVWNTSTYVHGFGAANGATTFDGYLTETNFIDGQALTPSSFGETNAITGVWQPKKYGGTYGTNGFYLNFSDNSGATATTIGKDYSGNGNNWTPNNISVTAGVTYDSMLDVPTPYADGGNGRGNYATLNAVDLGYSATTSEANLKVSTASSGNAASASTMALSTNTYWEVTIGSNSQVGLIWGRASDAYGNSSISMFANGATGSLANATRTLSATPSWSNGDTLGLAWNSSTRVLTLYQAGSATAVMTILTPATGDPQAVVTNYTSGSAMSSQVNFGQRPFTYTPPTGFVALNTQNLPAPTISNGASYMAATLYTGTGASQNISNAVNGISMQPDLVWIKRRNAAYDHDLFDAVRGAGLSLYSSTTAAEGSGEGQDSFNTNGFTVSGNHNRVNISGGTFAAWQWNAGGSTVTNTSGSISAQVRANATAGFSVVTFTSTGSSGAVTVGHGLGVAPAMVITKERGAVGSWGVYHTGLTTPASQYLNLQTTGAATTNTSYWGNTNPTSTVVTLGNGTMMALNTTMVMYCFAPVAGYSAFGSYTGNGSTDGTFVYTGFRPKFVMFKRSSSTGDWGMWDTSRNTYNESTSRLSANSSAAELNQAATTIDILSNGVKFRTADSDINASGSTYIYMAFAEVPFKNSLAR
jgi:hypothetical protein